MGPLPTEDLAPENKGILGIKLQRFLLGRSRVFQITTCPPYISEILPSGILLSAGMMMLPPIIISLPFKIILFILVDGWRLLARSLVTSFSGV